MAKKEPTPEDDKALKVACRECGSGAGERCRRPSKRQVNKFPHAARVIDAVNAGFITPVLKEST
jgi:hypothetical protein